MSDCMIRINILIRKAYLYVYIVAKVKQMKSSQGGLRKVNQHGSAEREGINQPGVRAWKTGERGGRILLE